MNLYKLAITNLKHIEPKDFGPEDCNSSQLSPIQVHGVVTAILNREDKSIPEQELFEEVMRHLNGIDKRIATERYPQGSRKRMLEATRAYLDNIRNVLSNIVMKRDKTFSATNYNFIDLMALIFVTNQSSEAKIAADSAPRATRRGRPPLAPRREVRQAASDIHSEMKDAGLLPQAPLPTTPEQQRLGYLLEQMQLRKDGEIQAETRLVNDYHPTHGYVTGHHVEIHYTYRYTPAQRVHATATQPGSSRDNKKTLKQLRRAQLKWVKGRITTLQNEKKSFLSAHHKRKDLKLAILMNLKERLEPSAGSIDFCKVITPSDITSAAQAFLEASYNPQRREATDIKKELYKGGIFSQSRTSELQRLSEVGKAISPRKAAAAA